MQTEDELMAALVATEMALWTDGYSEDAARMATRQAFNWARGMAARLPPEIRDQAFCGYLLDRLASASAWLDGVSGAADDFDRAIDRAVRDDRHREGFARLGLDSAGLSRRWREAEARAKDGYRRRFPARADT